MSSFPTRNRKFKKNSKKFKKLKTNILATFQAKISWEWPRKRENKRKNRSEEFLPDPQQKIPKKQKTLLWLLFEAKYVGEGRERYKKKKIGRMSSYPTRNRKFQKIAKKIKKTKNHHFGNFSGQNKLGKAEKERK